MHALAARGDLRFDLADFASEVRRVLYAVKRRDALTRRGERPDDASACPFEPGTWQRNARHRRDETQDRRDHARAARGRGAR